ncbi:MAG: helix-turn-helix domain-containing protein [Bdellovibrionota bacterium]|nr:helix-turn-helix domain-containing protein [Bdellovibrionota bacterium]
MEEINVSETNNGNMIVTNQENTKITLGMMLKQAREDKGFSIEMISRHTKINVSALHAIEKEDLDNLPNIAFLRGFVKSYAKIVDIPEADALDKLNELYNIEKSVEKEEVPQEEETSQVTTEESSSGNNTMIYKASAVAIVLVLILIGFVSKNGDTKESKETVVEKIVEDNTIKTVQINENTPLKKVTSPGEDATVQADQPEGPSSESNETKEDVKAANEDLKKEDQKESEAEKIVAEKAKEKEEVKDAKDTNETEKEEVAAAESDNKKEDDKKEEEKEIRFYNITLPMFEIIDDKEALATHVPEQFQQSIEEGKQNLFINADNGDTWITYKKDNDPIKKFILKKGKMLMIRGDEIKIFFGNVLETKVFLNNQLLSIKTKSGVKSIVLPESLARETKLPLFIFKKDGSVQTSDEYIKNLEEEKSSEIEQSTQEV